MSADGRMSEGEEAMRVKFDELGKILATAMEGQDPDQPQQCQRLLTALQELQAGLSSGVQKLDKYVRAK